MMVAKIKKVASHSVAAIDREMLRSFIPLVHLVCCLMSSVLELVNSTVQTKCHTKDCSCVILLHLAVDPVVVDGEWYLDSPSLVIVESLLMAGADVDSMDADRNTPLHVAVINRKRRYQSQRDAWLEVINLLLEHDAHVDFAPALPLADRRSS